MASDPRLLILAGMLSVWLFFGGIYWRQLRRLPPPGAELRWFYLTGAMRWMGLPVLLLGPALVVLMLILIPLERQDFLPALFIALFLGGLVPLAGLLLLLTRYRMDATGLTGYNHWGLPTFVAWHQVTQIKLSAASQSLRFEGGPQSIYIMAQLHQWPDFIAAIERQLPHLTLPAELQSDSRLRHDGELLAFEGHWQGMYDFAARILLVAALLVVASAIFLPPHPQAWALSALGGVSFAIYPLLRRLLPKPRKYSASIGNLLQFLGVMIPSVALLPAAYRRHVDALGGETSLQEDWLVSVTVQHLGISILVMAALIQLAKWRWPQRFSRSQMTRPDRAES